MIETLVGFSSIMLYFGAGYLTAQHAHRQAKMILTPRQTLWVIVLWPVCWLIVIVTACVSVGRMLWANKWEDGR